ncbi:MAG: 30S ribosomal protein S12 methylthiotransferase RimO [Bacteroidales bacterium]|nr:30S ribosomal protein S12 methylthiotransferase RimO [Bacteroidales bacterium]
MKKRVGFITLGCSKNVVDTEKIAAHINQNAYVILFLDKPEPVNVLIINTCGFILDAKKESIETILHAIELKKNKQINKIYVTGCLSTRYLDELKSEIPEVDSWFTVHNFQTIADYLNQSSSVSDKHFRYLSTPTHYAYLKIAEGCNRKCSFCAIPIIRGRYHSEPIEHLIAEAKELASKGVKELILVAQDLTYYGIDIQKRPLLVNLLRQISHIDGIEWIRLQYTYPQNFTNELIEEIRTNPKICKYIDIPIQHISERMLKLMRRNHSQKTLKSLLYKLRERIPQIHLRTTVIIGHPGETKKDFNELLDFIKEFEFEKLGAFAYSHEENTYAATHFKDNITNKVKQERLNLLMEIQQEISYKKNKNLIGTFQRVIIDRKENDFFIGRTQFDSPDVDNETLIYTTQSLQHGHFYDVKITDAFEFDLIAQMK